MPELNRNDRLPIAVVDALDDIELSVECIQRALMDTAGLSPHLSHIVHLLCEDAIGTVIHLRGYANK